MLLTPSLVSIKPFTPKEDKTFDFYYQGSTQIIKNQLEVYRINDNVRVYNQTVNSLQFKHQLPSSTLVFGNYKARIRVGDMSGSWSSYSEWIFFWVLDKPNITIPTISDGKVFNQTVTFEANYTHPNYELLESYRYLLYDSEKNLLNSFSEIFSDGSIPLKQEIAGLQNDYQYYVEIKSISINGQEYSTELIPFRPFYVAPRLFATMTTENIASQGAVKISANLLQMLGDVKGDFSYIDDEWINLKNGVLTFDKGFEISDPNFTLKLWCKDIKENSMIVKLYSKYGHLELWKKGNYIYCYKYINNIKYPSLHISNELFNGINDEFMIFLRSKNHTIELEQLKISEVVHS